MAGPRSADASMEREREDRQAEKLLERVARLGDSLVQGATVSPALVREGLTLLDRYLHTIYLDPIDRSTTEGGPAPEMPVDFLRLDRILHHHAESRCLNVMVLDLLDAYERGKGSAGSLLGFALLDAAQTDHEAIRSETRHPQSCVLDSDTGDTSSRLRNLLESKRMAFLDLDRRIERYLLASDVELTRS